MKNEMVGVVLESEKKKSCNCMNVKLHCKS